MLIHQEFKTQRNNNITIYGSNLKIKIFYKVPAWSNEEEPAFKYRDNIYFLSEFMKMGKFEPDWMQEYSAYLIETAFSGILVKIDDKDNEHVKVYYYVG